MTLIKVLLIYYESQSLDSLIFAGREGEFTCSDIHTYSKKP